MTPVFSIIIPTYERHDELSQCLSALSGVDYPRERFEVIVVNDGGSAIDRTIAPFAGQMNVTYVTRKHSGPAAARNTGVQRARGKNLAFTDDDCRPDPGWLAEMERRLVSDPSVMVGGRVVNVAEDNAYSSASQLLVTYLYEYYNEDREQARFITSNNMAMARETLLAAGGFNEDYRQPAAEDRELCDRWLQFGHRIVYAEDALIRHSHRLTLISFVAQHFRYGRGAVRYHRDRARRAANPVKIEPLRFYTGLLRYPWTVGLKRPLRIATLLFIAQTANALGFFREKLFSAG
jgi:GT2 family glycosyltransferase